MGCQQSTEVSSTNAKPEESKKPEGSQKRPTTKQKGPVSSTNAKPEESKKPEGSQKRSRTKRKAPSKKHSLTNHLIVSKHDDFRDAYEIVERVGEGSISNIIKVKKKNRDGCVYAVKEIDVDLVKPEYMDEMHNEIDLLKTLDHPNVIKAYETYEMKKGDKAYMAIVMELCTGGDLNSRGPQTEQEAAMLVGKLCSALRYLHKHKVIHRDIKFENLMFESDKPDAEIKVIDFGLSTRYQPKETLTDRVGTLYTMAPEVTRGNYSSQADMWSVGVVTYQLLSGEKPFWGNNQKEILKLVRAGKYNFDGPAWKLVSQDAKNFIKRLLEIEPKLRYTADQALKSPWLKKKFNIDDRKLDETAANSITANIDSYAKQNEFKKLALQVIARKADTEDIIKLRKAFDEFDENNDGTISYKEFQRALAKTGQYSKEEIDRIFRSVDVHGTGEVEYTEFLAATMEAHGRLEEQRIAEAFEVFDEDGSGFITRQELREILGDCDERYIEDLVKEIDANGDGKIDFSEFMGAFQAQKRSSIREMK